MSGYSFRSAAMVSLDRPQSHISRVFSSGSRKIPSRRVCKSSGEMLRPDRLSVVFSVDVVTPNREKSHAKDVSGMATRKAFMQSMLRPQPMRFALSRWSKQVRASKSSASSGISVPERSMEVSVETCRCPNTSKSHKNCTCGFSAKICCISFRESGQFRMSTWERFGKNESACAISAVSSDV